MRFWKTREAEVAEEGVKESREERRGSGEGEATASVPVSSRDRRAAEPDPNNVPPALITDTFAQTGAYSSLLLSREGR